MSDVFFWIGVLFSAAVALSAIGFGCLWLWFNLLHERFSLILFRRMPRRISIASWHQSKVARKGQSEINGDYDWPADDHVVGPHPFYVAYKIGGIRLFMMAGTLREYRNSSIKGTHP